MKGPTIRRVAEMMADLRSPIRAWHSGRSLVPQELTDGHVVDPLTGNDLLVFKGKFTVFHNLNWAWALTADGHWHTWVWED